MDFQWPATAAATGSRIHGLSTPRISRVSKTASAPLDRSPMNTMTAGTTPTFRKTLDAPGSPVPISKMSTPLWRRLMRYANGIEPSKYPPAVAINTTGSTSRTSFMAAAPPSLGSRYDYTDNQSRTQNYNLNPVHLSKRRTASRKPSLRSGGIPWRRFSAHVSSCGVFLDSSAARALRYKREPR